ncbi:unnamed protein product [Mytilus edulis]|uniref:Reverse transcriptase domain-containing protein n=1 Tax=Mytilus edulis TaxID=6550 RepID=A0A8S3QIT9_MYTED|nr:unnamed protein product [Mytilus edulis]
MFLDTIDPTNYIGYGKGADDNCHQLFNFNIRGGVAFLVSKRLQPFIEVLDIPSNRITGIELNIPDTPNIYLISVYLPAVTQSYELFSKEVEILIDVYNIYSTMGTVVLMGDFNCKIEGPRYTFDYDKRSDSFRSFMQECNLRSLHLETNGIGPVCTFQSYQGGPKTAIDHIIVSIENLTKFSKIQVPDEHMFNVSDHKPIRCSFALSDNTNYVSKDDDLTAQRRISWTKAVQNGAIADYSFAVSQFLWDIKSPTATPANIEQYYSEIVNAILRADMETLPGKQYVKHLKPYWTKTMKEYHTIMRTWIENGKFHDRKDKHYGDYKSAKLNFRKQLELAYENYISEINRKIEESVDCDQRFVWSVIKSGRKSVSHCQQLNISGIQLISSDEIRDGWVTHFQSVFSFDSNLINPVNEKAIDNTINDLLETVRTNTNENIEEFTFDELYKLCDNLPCNKSPGLDGICGNKSKSDPNSYRGISLLCSISKLFEKALYTRLPSLHHNFPHLSQVAYQKTLSSIHASFNMQEVVHHNLERHSNIIVTFLDSMKAFDILWHKGLLVKLYIYGVRGLTWLLIYEMYQNMRSCVQFKGKCSKWFNLKKGVRQGGVLSAVFYLVFINDLLRQLDESPYGSMLFNLRVSSTVQADDIALISTTSKGMKTLIDICQTYSENWGFRFSSAKSEVLKFCSSKCATISQPLKLYGADIPVVTSTKHVGIILNAEYYVEWTIIYYQNVYYSTTTTLEFRNKCSKKQDGFVPDLIKIAVRYDLINFVEDFVKSGIFPSKTVWNRYISTSIANSENNRWQQRISVDSDFEIFRKIHKHIVPHRAWVIAKTNPNFREGAKYIVDLCSVIRTEESPLLCDKCGQFFYNVIEHIMCMCDRLSDLRAKLWEDLISINPIVFSVYLDNLTSSTFTATLLSCYTEYDLDNDNSIYFSKTCITHVQRIGKFCNFRFSLNVMLEDA